MGEESDDDAPWTPIVRENIYYRDPAENLNFLGPFTEARIQWWYRQGFFHSGVEFRMGRRGEVFRLDRLRQLNGIACPFSFLISAQSRSELEEITSRFKEHSTLAHQVLMMMREEHDHMREMFQRMERKLKETQKGIEESHKRIDERVAELEEHHVGLAERAEEWLEKLPDVERNREPNNNTIHMGGMDEKVLEEIRRMENQVMLLNQERVRINKRVRSVEESCVAMPWTRRWANSEESEEETKGRLRREKDGRQLMWNSCQMLGHGSALVDYGSRAPEAKVKALQKALQRCDEKKREEMARGWDRLVDFSNAKCLFCHCSLKSASDFVDHLISGPHMSILRWCHVSSECLNFFTDKLKEINPVSDGES